MGLELQGTGKVSPCVVRETKLSILVLGQCWHTEGHGQFCLICIEDV